MEDLVVEVFKAVSQHRVPQRFVVLKVMEDPVEVFKAFPQLRVQQRLAELNGGLQGLPPRQSFQPSHELIAVTPAPGGDPQDLLPAQGSKAMFGGGRPAGGSQNFVPGQISTEFGGADDDDEFIRRSNELLEYTRRECLFSSDEEEEDEEEEEEEETEDEQPLRFRGLFRPRRSCLHFFQGQCWRGSSCTFAHSYDELHPDVQGQW